MMKHTILFKRQKPSELPQEVFDENAVTTPDTAEGETPAPTCERVLILTDEEKNVFFSSLTEAVKAYLPEDADTACFYADSEEVFDILSENGIEAILLSEFVDPTDRRVLTIILPSEENTPLTFDTSYPFDSDEATLADAVAALFKEESIVTEAPEDTEPPAPSTPFSHIIFEWLELFVVSLAAVLIIMTFFIRHSPVSGESMLPTLHPADVLLLTETGFTPECGDIVIIQTPKDDLRRPLVKRVIATSGQTVRINFETWEIFIDDKLLDEPYLDKTDKSSTMEVYLISYYFEKVDPLVEIYEATVPEHHIFALGDNRQNSKDSRTLGFIDERHVIGEVVYRILPFSRMGETD